MANLSWLKDCPIQRQLHLVSRIESPTGNLHLLNIHTGQMWLVGNDAADVWQKIDGTKTALEVVKGLVQHHPQKIRRSLGKRYVKAIEFLLTKKYIYIVQPAQSIVFSNYPFYKMSAQINPAIRYHRASPDIIYLFETRTQKKNPFLLLNHFYGRVWEKLVAGLTIKEVIKSMSNEFGQRVDEELLIEFIINLEEQGLITFGSKAFKEYIPTEDKKFSLIKFHHHDENAWKFNLEEFIIETRVPWFVVWELTYACNFRCKHCYAADYGSQEIPLEVDNRETRMLIVKRFIDAGLTHVTLMGGEPFIVPELLDIIQKLRENHIFVKIQSNGSLLTEEKVRELERVSVNQVELSLDGTTAQINDSIRGRGTYNKIINGLELLRDSNIPKKGICYTITTNNFYDVDNVPAFVEAHEIDEVFFSKFFAKGRGEKYANWCLSPEQRTMIRTKIIKFNEDDKDSKRVYFAIWDCKAGKTYCVVSPYGEIRPCTLHDYIVGNLKEQTFPELWQANQDLFQLRYPYLYKRVCTNCAEKLTCKGTFCSAIAYHDYKQLIVPDCLKNYKIAPD